MSFRSFMVTNVPTDFHNGTQAINTGWFHTCMSKIGQAKCFGMNQNGQTDVLTGFADGAQ